MRRFTDAWKCHPILRSNVTYRALNAWKKLTSFLVRDKYWTRVYRNCVRDHRVSPNNSRVSSRDCVRVSFYWAVYHCVDIRNRARVTIRRAGQLQAVDPRGTMCHDLSISPSIDAFVSPRSNGDLRETQRASRPDCDYFETRKSILRSRRFSRVPRYVLLMENSYLRETFTQILIKCAFAIYTDIRLN